MGSLPCGPALCRQHCHKGHRVYSKRARSRALSDGEGTKGGIERAVIASAKRRLRPRRQNTPRRYVERRVAGLPCEQNSTPRRVHGAPTFTTSRTAQSRQHSEREKSADRAAQRQSSTNFRLSGAPHHAKRLILLNGWVAEWFKAPVLKDGAGCPCRPLRSRRVRISSESPRFSDPQIPPRASPYLAVRCQFRCQVLLAFCLPPRIRPGGI